ncbi:MAG: hypothetical protein GXP62_04630, partial [Oligoflexia bacterium]|nr:hypothetical protein [Oligoflexia bacterium]
MEIVAGATQKDTVEQIIQGAEKQVMLFSPYFDPWQRLTEVVTRAIGVRDVKVFLIVRGGRDAKKQLGMAKRWEKLGVEVRTKDHLHAKVYLSEKAALVTSLNLLKSSVLDSWELGMLLTQPGDSVILRKLHTQLRPLVQEVKEEHHLSVARALDLTPSLSISGLEVDLPAARAKPVRSSRARTTARTTTKTTRRRT